MDTSQNKDNGFRNNGFLSREYIRRKNLVNFSNVQIRKTLLNQDNVSIYLKFKVNTIYVMRHKMCSKAQTKGAQIQINQWGREGTGGRSAE